MDVDSTTWPDYLRAAMTGRYSTPAALARALDVSDSVVSRWLRGQTQPEVPHLRRLAHLLNRPILELLVAAGHLEPDEVDLDRLPVPQPVTVVDVVDAIEADADLLPEAKAHLANQYGLLLRIQDVSSLRDRKKAGNQPGLRAVARKRRGTDGRGGGKP